MTKRAEKEQRLRLTCQCLAAGMRDGDIKRAVSSKFGCAPRSVERDITEARRQLRAHRDRDRADLQAESMAFYEQILQNPQAKTGDKLFARKRLDQLLGLEEPQKLEHSGPAGGPIRTESGIDREVQKMLDDPELEAEVDRVAQEIVDKSIEQRRDQNDES